MRRTLIIVLGLLVLPGLPAFAGKKLPSYDVVRAKLVRQGYSPVAVTHGDTSYFCWEGFCDAYPEAVSCTAGGLPYCSMGFRKPGGRGYIVVDTEGERVHYVRVVRRRTPNEGELCSMKEGHDDRQECASASHNNQR